MITLRDTTRKRIRELRTARGISQQGLAKRVNLLGAKTDRTTVAKIEKGSRELTLMEAFQFAYALDVAPVHLFVPTEDPDIEISIGPNLIAPPDEIRAWIRGQYPLHQDARVYFSQVPKSEFSPGAGADFERTAGIVVSTDPDAER